MTTMTYTDWDPDLAVTYGPLDTQLDGLAASDRYGVTELEEIAGEPLAVALAQEEPDLRLAEPGDDPWVLVDLDWNAYGPLFARVDNRSAEEAAMHVERL